MKLKAMLPLTLAGALMASTAGAQTVIESFDNLVDQVLGTVDSVNTNAAFFSGAVNIEDIDGSVDITGGASNAPGSVVTESTSDIDNSVATATDNTVVNQTSDGVGGSTDNTQFAIDNTITTATVSTTESTTETFDAVTQQFGDVSSVAAGAVNDGTLSITETGSMAELDIATSTSGTDFQGTGSNTTGSTIGSVQLALNTGFVDGSISMNLLDANGGATSVGSVAAGAINTSDVSAEFVGSSDSIVSIFAP